MIPNGSSGPHPHDDPPPLPGGMDFTRHFIRSKNPCANGHQDLDALVDAGRVDDACWLLDQLGPTSAVLALDALEAGWGTRCAGDIRARGAIRAGESLAARGEIRAGPGYGVFAGLCVPRDTWDVSARVSASTRPEGLMSGWWSGEGWT